MITGKTTNPNPVTVFVPYDAIFNDGPTTFENFKQIVKSLSRTDTLFWCARLNLIIDDPNLDEKSKQQCCLDYFFTPQQVQVLNNYIKGRESSAKVGVVNRGTLMELIRWVSFLCSDHEHDGTTYDKQEIRSTFAKALLMANEFWAKRIYGNSAFKGTSIVEKRMNALALIRHSMAETRCHSHPFEEFENLARGAKLFGEIFPNFYPDFLVEFHKSTGLHLDDYYLCLCAIMAQYTNAGEKSGVGGKKESGIFTLKNIRDSAPHMEELFRKFLALQSATPEELTAAFWPGMQEEPTGFDYKYSLKPVRERPILKAADGRMIILDPICFAEKASIGPLFHLMNTDASQKTSHALFTKFGHAFEAYVGNILKYIYPDPGSHLAKRLYFDVREAKNNGIQVADFIIDDVTDIIIIEAKAVWIQDKKMSQHDPEVFVEHLRARYRGENKEKGYAQLARNITKISSYAWQSAGIDLSRTKRMYPLLLVHDALLDAPVFGHFLAEEFKHELQPDSLEADGWMVKGRFRVAPLVVMTVNDLEYLESSLSRFTLVDLLKAYSRATPDRLVSLNNFLAADSEQFPLYHNKSLASGCETILAECMRRVFSTKEEITIAEGSSGKKDGKAE